MERYPPKRPEDTPLAVAAELGKFEIARYLISKGADMNSCIWPAILQAYRSGDISFLDYLINKGMDINQLNDYGESPFHCLLMLKPGKNKTRVMKLFLSSGADVNMPSSKGQTPLMLAAYENDVKAVRILLARKVEINARDENKYTALLHTASYGSQFEKRTEEPLETFKLLVEAGADINACDYRGTSALMLASQTGRINIVKYLISLKVKIDKADESKRTALHRAAHGNYLEVVRLLIDSGANINAKNIWGYTVIIYAIDNRNVKMARLAIAKGADVNLKTKHGTALAYAKRKLKHPDRDPPRNTPLEEIVKILKAAGAKEAP